MADRERQRLIFAHQEWLGFVQPVGLVVSPPVMVDAQVVPDRNVSGRQREFIALLERDDTGATARWRAPDLRRVFLDWLGWDEADLADADTDRERLEIALPELHAVLAPTWAVPADGGNEGGEAADISNGEAAGHGHKEAASHGAGESAGNSDRESAGSDDGKAAGWQMLIRVEPDGADLDAPPADAAWNASRHERFVRLLSETGVPAGLLCTDDRIRLIHAPGGETPGYLTFDFSQMAMPAGRPILAAFDMLLSAGAMFMNAEEARLPALLARSREAQAEVSTRLARQVLAALYELLRGFVAADAHRGALPALARESPDHLYSGLIVVLMRLVFLLYTEDRGMMPGHPVYQQHYSLGGLFARLRADAAAYPDTMDQRFGAWAQLLSLFRLVYGGGRHGNLSFVARKGRLFDPARFPFLERLPPSKRSGSAEAAEAGTVGEGEVPPGQPPARSPGFPDPEVGTAGEAALPPGQPSARPPEFPAPEAGSADETAVPPAPPSPGSSGRRRAEDEADIPLVPDRTVWRVLENLVMLDGERLSYRTLDVEQIGSVYEAIMGFRVELTAGRSIAVRSRQRTGAAVVIDLDALLSLDPGKRAKAVAERTDHKLTGKAEAALRQAGTVEDAVAALEGRIDRDATPDVVPAHTPVLQPTDERRRSGSHYTPSTLTGPIVADALRPLFDHLGPSPAPDRILDLKILDPAMGSGAFLVEACRQLARKLVEAWHAHGGPPAIPPDEDELLHARRLVAQHCLYGVDKNAMAVDLARLSLWLVTFAKDHEFTFINHALRHGDSLTGLSLAQIQALHWREDIPAQVEMEEQAVRRCVATARALRARIHAARESATADELDDLLGRAESELYGVRTYGDLVLLAFFKGKKPAERDRIREEHAAYVLTDRADRYRDEIEAWRSANPPFAPFHWEIEFPEVFERENPGFDAVVGNPPFAGKNTVIAAHVAGYLHWLKAMHEESHGNADLVAHFFRRAFSLMRDGGAFGLIATNTIAQGDTRATGLRFICEHGGEIYRARRRVKWPGLAAVVVSVLHVAKSSFPVATAKCLDGGAASDHGAGILSAGLFPGAMRLDGEAAPDHGAGTSSAGSLPGAKRLDGEAALDHRSTTLPAGSFSSTKRLDGRAVETITAFLFHRGGHGDPERLAANAGRSFVGSYVLGMGFTFDDTDRKGVASPLAEMRRLIEKDPRNREVIFPYIGGEEVNTSPIHAHHRYVINFRDWPLRREGDGGSREGVGELWASAGDRRRRHPSRREDGGESEGVGEAWADAGDQQRRYPSHREDGGESKGVREAWTDAGDRRRRYPLRREDGGESWADADEKRRRELRRQPIVPHDYPEPVAADWPELLAIVEERVKPERLRGKRETRRKRWWQFGDRQPALQAIIKGLERVLANSRISQHAAFTFLPNDRVYAETTIIFPFDTHCAFCTLQSRPHEIWARFFASSLGDGLRYTPSDCFETFPFPEHWEAHPALEAAGKAYYDFRAALMARNDEGLTRTYNRFHDPDETDPDIAELRALHAAMDRAVLDAYGWRDVPTDCEFLLDYEIDEEEWGRRKKPYRYRWPDAIRDEILARLLALNAERAEAERAAADHE